MPRHLCVAERGFYTRWSSVPQAVVKILQSEEEAVLLSRWLWRKEKKQKDILDASVSKDCDLKLFYVWELLMIMLLLSFLRTPFYPIKMLLPEKS